MIDTVKCTEIFGHKHLKKTYRTIVHTFSLHRAHHTCKQIHTSIKLHLYIIFIFIKCYFITLLDFTLILITVINFV